MLHEHISKTRTVWNLLIKSFRPALHGAIAWSFCCSPLHAQNLYNNKLFSVKGTASLYISGSFTNASSASYVNDASVTIKGNIANSQASMAQGSGNTFITGSSVQALSGTQAFVVNNVTINNTSAGSSNFTFSNNLTVGGTATFTDGIVVTNANKMSFLHGATYTGASNASHVNGFVEKTGNVAFTFPVGDGTLLRPASIAAPSATTDVFIGKYFYSNPNPTFNTASKAAVLDTVSNCEYWTINRTSGTSNVKITLTWENPNSSCLKYTSPADVYVAGWDGSMWQSFANGGTTGNSAAGSVISNTAPSTYSAFALAKRNIPLPVVLAYFKGDKTQEGNKLSWKTTSETASKMFVVERSCDGKSWTPIGSISSHTDSKEPNKYALTDVNPCSETGYYKLVEMATDGTRREYSVLMIDNTGNYKANFQLYPNPTAGYFHINVEGDAPKYSMELTDALGQTIGTFTLVNGDNTIDCSHFAPGVYLTQFSLGKEKVVKKLVLN